MAFFVFLLACNRGGGSVANEKALETIYINAHNADKRLYCQEFTYALS